MENNKNTELEKTLALKREEERKRQGIEVAIENEWWADNVITDEKKALERNELIKVPDNTENYCLIGVLRREEEPKSLNPKAFSLLEKIGDLWKEEMLKQQYTEQVRLSISSLFRTSEWQEDRIKKGINAASVSPHQAGTAIDFDPNGYYLGSEKKATNRSNPDFKEEYISILKNVLLSLEKSDECHIIWEKGYKIENERITEYDNCWHVCVKP